jgi:hypothetical protein
MANSRGPDRDLVRLWNEWTALESMATKIASRALSDFPACQSLFELEDLIAEAKLILARILPRWRSDQGPLENFYFRTLRLELRRLLRNHLSRATKEQVLDFDLQDHFSDKPHDGEVEHLLAHLSSREALGTIVLLRELLGLPLSLRKRALCFRLVYGEQISKSTLHRARGRALALIRNAVRAR